MLWQAKHRPQSPSRSSDSAAKTKHHSDAMDSRVADLQMDEASVFATTPGESPIPSDTEQDQTKKQTASSVDDGLSYALTPEDDLQSPTTSKNAKARKHRDFISITATRSRPRILALLVCTSYLLFHLLGVDLGFRLIKGYTEPRLHRAEVQLHAAESELFVEQYLYDYVFDTTLNQRHGESYEQCLARGLYVVDELFLGLDFARNLEVRNRTMEWATDNCGRLLHTPQLARPEVPKFRITASNYRQFAEKAFSLIRNRVALLRSRWFGMHSQLAARFIVVEQSNSTPQRPEVLVKMPSGFTLDCKEPPPCRLVYSGLSDSINSKTTSKDAVAEARKQVQKWSWSLDKVLRINRYIVGIFAVLQPLFGNMFLLAILISRPRPQPKSPLSSRLAGVRPHICNTIARLREEEQLALGLIIHSALYVFLHYQLKYIIEEFDRPLLPVGACFCAFHVPQILAFFDPVTHKMDSIRSFCRSIKELYMIARGVEPPQPATKERPSTHQSSDAKPASKIAAHFVSPLTPISEDIRQERKAMHAEQQRADFELDAAYATETDSEYDSDVQDASYIDLPRGATPTFSEDGSDWSMVDN